MSNPNMYIFCCRKVCRNCKCSEAGHRRPAPLRCPGASLPNPTPHPPNGTTDVSASPAPSHPSPPSSGRLQADPSYFSAHYSTPQQSSATSTSNSSQGSSPCHSNSRQGPAPCSSNPSQNLAPPFLRQQLDAASSENRGQTFLQFQAKETVAFNTQKPNTNLAQSLIDPKVNTNKMINTNSPSHHSPSSVNNSEPASSPCLLQVPNASVACHSSNTLSHSVVSAACSPSASIPSRSSIFTLANGLPPPTLLPPPTVLPPPRKSQFGASLGVSLGGVFGPASDSRHSDDDSGCALEEYTWVPPGLKPEQVST